MNLDPGKRFWVRHQDKPVSIHETLDDAIAAANTLLTEHPGERFEIWERRITLESLR